MKITIEVLDANNTFGTRVFIDGVEHTDLTRIVFDHIAGRLPYLRLDRYEKRDDEYVIKDGDLKREIKEYDGDSLKRKVEELY